MININIYATLPSTLPSVRQCSVSIADFNRIEQSELRIYYYRLKKNNNNVFENSIPKIGRNT